ncbi:MAG: hypothetical protein PWR01_3202, partial [Clostridiales bacterium]|nr:hypothetical protein [Clostridiales bacterium]MDN5282129.1 hypothetical protein [Candidatus Ozemobacter sp.]
MSLVKKVIIVIAAVLLLPALICAETGWVSRGNIEISATGTIQITLPPKLHRLYVDENRESSNDLDLSLVGPDNNKRSFELFWRESGDMGAMMLKPDRVELKDDHSLVWEAEVPENYLFNSVKVSLPYAPDAARLNFYGSEDNEWEEIDKNVAVMRPSAQSPHGLANVKFKERSFEKVRIVFSGFDKNFKDAPIKSVAVMIEGRRGGMEYQNVTKELDFEEIWRDDILELRARMPGSGILIDEIEVSTEAFFKGKWRLGRERIVLGKADFVELTSGKIEAVDTDPNKIVIKPGMIWRDRMLIIQLESSDYFGKITSIKGNMRVPNLVFVADIIGNYQLQTGYNQRQKILEYAGNLDRRPDFILEVGLIEVNPKGQSETLVKDFAIQGGPFNAEGFTWKSPIQVENPGFYQLQVAAKVALENHAESLRIVRDGMQVPFFHGRTEQREEPLNYTPEYDAAKNQSIFTVRLPDGKVVPRELRIKTSGIFERKVILQKHQAGMVGWQNWKTTTCRNDDNSPIDLQLSLAGFPADQKDLRVIIENGSNQSLKIEAISALYQAQDLYFIANTSGTYELYGGHPSIKGAKYDLNIIQNKLLELFPEKISHGDLEDISADSEISVSGQDKGGPFESSGYQWVA